MKYLKYFKEDSEYTQFKNSSDYVTPNVSYIEATNGIYYEAPVVIPNNYIYYTTSDGNIVDIILDNFEIALISNTYSDGIGIIEFDGDVMTIDERAFYYCSNLTSITLPASVTRIENEAFSGCESLTSVTIPDSVTSIGNNAFNYCTSLTSIAIPNSVTTIGISAFDNCSSLTSITIPNSVTSIGTRAFEGCTGELIINSKIVETNFRYGNHPSYMYWLVDTNFTKLTIGDSITKIGNYVFYDCRSLESITIPESVTSIGEGAFNLCDGLTSVYCKATTPPVLSDTSIFDNNASGRKIYVPAGSVETYKSAANWNEYADAIVGYNF